MGKLSGNIENFTFAASGVDVDFKVAKISGNEGISVPFEFRLHLVCENADIDFASIISKTGTVTFISDNNDTERFIHGVIADFEVIDNGERLTTYSALLVPQLWNLTHMADCRIFQTSKTPDIIKKILDDAKIASDHYKINCKETYPPREYCVQYRETDFNFISRLMEEDGIYYYFEHYEDRHVMVIADKSVVHQEIASPATVRYQKPGGQVADEDTVYPFTYAERVCTGSVILKDYLFRKPTLNLRSKQACALNPELEVYDYPGRYPITDLGDDSSSTGTRLATVLMEAAQAGRARGEGKSDCMRFTAGYRFTLDKHPREALNQDWLVTRVDIQAEQPAVYEENASGEGSTFRAKFTALPASVQYRAPRRAVTPVVRGVQSAFVTGPAGEEIYTDEFGRVKVQFHWDREGKNDEKSSCWIRVNQTMAGAGWGSVSIPRVGHEVIVDFIDGDPDRPIILGQVYHGTNRPPFDLPASGMVSGMKSNSTPGGGGSNEMSMNDTKGKETLTIHAQKDMNATVENNRSSTIVSGNDTLAVQAGTRSVTVKGNTSLTVQAGDRTVNVTGNYKLDTTSEINMQAPTKITLTCGGSSVTLEPGKITLSAGGGASVTLDANALMQSAAGSKVLLDGNANTQSSAGSKVLLDGNALMTSTAGDKVLLDGKATMSSPGEALVDAPTATLSGGGSTAKADASGVAIAGPKISLNG